MKNPAVELSGTKKKGKRIKQNWQLYLMLLLPVVYLFVFAYYPMLGAQIAFKDFKISKGIWGSEWVGFEHFERFLSSYQFKRVLVNTISLSALSLIVGFPLPIILALLLNYCNSNKYKKIVQTVTYAPYFISTIVLVGMLNQFFSPRGIVNIAITGVGGSAIDFFGSPGKFPWLYVLSGVWQCTGYSSIIYVAVLANSDPQIHEAAIIDGANKLQRMHYVDFPVLIPTAVILLIMNCGQILAVGFEKVYAMQNSLNLRTSEVISTYIYKTNFESVIPDFSYSTAVGLFQSAVGLIFVIIVNKISKKLTENSLW